MDGLCSSASQAEAGGSQHTCAAQTSPLLPAGACIDLHVHCVLAAQLTALRLESGSLKEALGAK